MRRIVLVVLSALVAVSVQVQPAGAALPGAAVLTGSGSSSPGIPVPLPGALNTASAVVTLTGAVEGDVGSVNCSLGFATGLVRVGSIVLAESLAFGSGSWNGSCSGTGVVTGRAISVNCSGSYARVASALVMTGVCTINGVLGSWTAALTWTPTNVNPTTAFLLFGSVVLVPGSI